MQANTNITIPETFDGLLSLTVCDAELKGQDIKENFEPYFKVSLGSSSLTQRLKEGETLGKERYTTTSKPQSGNHPVWNESHDFSIHKMKQDSHLKLKLFDHNNLLKDNFLGLTRIDLSELVRNLSNQKQYYDIHDKTQNSIGRVGIITKFVGMDLPVQQVKKEPTGHDIHDQAQTGGAVGAVGAGGVGARELRKDDQGVEIGDQDRFSGREIDTKEPDKTVDLGQSEKAYDRSKSVHPKDEERSRTPSLSTERVKDEPIAQERLSDVNSSVQPGIKDDIKERPDSYQPSTVEKGKEKLAEAATLAGPTYRQTMPEALGGGYPVKPGVVKDESGDVISSTQPQSLIEKGKEKFSQAATLAGPTYRQTMPEALGGGYPVQAGTIKEENGEVISRPGILEKGKEKFNQATTDVKETYVPQAQAMLGKGKEKLSQAAILAGPTYRQTMPEALGGGYPVKPATIKDESGNVVAEHPTVLEKGKATLSQAAEKAKETYRENLPKAQQMLEEGKAKLSQAATLAGPTYRQTMPEALGGGYPVKPAVIKDEQGNVISEKGGFQSDLELWKAQQPSLLERAKQTLKEKAPEALGGKPALGDQSDLEREQAQQPSLLERAKQTFRETAPEALGGRPALEGERTLTEKVQEKIAEGKEHIHSSSSSSSDSTSQTGGLLGLVKQTITEIIPEMIGLKAIDESETKHDTQQTETERSGDIQHSSQPEGENQTVRVVDEIRKVDMDEAGHVTQIETAQNVSHIPVSVKDILVKPVDVQKTEDAPLNEQPVFERPLTDNYEFQGESVPPPSSQKVHIPTPQIITSPQHQESTFQQGSSFH